MSKTMFHLCAVLSSINVGERDRARQKKTINNEL